LDAVSQNQLKIVAFSPSRYISQALLYNRVDHDTHFGWI